MGSANSMQAKMQALLDRRECRDAAENDDASSHQQPRYVLSYAQGPMRRLPADAVMRELSLVKEKLIDLQRAVGTRRYRQRHQFPIPTTNSGSRRRFSSRGVLQ